MARITQEQAKEMSASNSNGINFFALEDRKAKKVRFLYNSPSDIEAVSVHQVVLPDGKRKTVDCLRAPNEPVQKCPLCESGLKPKGRIYLALISEDSADRGTVYIWERSAQFIDTLQGHYNRYCGQNNIPFVDYVFEIERHGAKGDTNTKYEVYPIGAQPVDKNSLPEVPDLSKLILEKDYNECLSFVNTGNFPSTEGATQPNNTMDRRVITPQYNGREEQPVQPTYQQQSYPQPTEIHYPNGQASAPQAAPQNGWGNPQPNNSGRRGW